MKFRRVCIFVLVFILSLSLFGCKFFGPKESNVSSSSSTTLTTKTTTSKTTTIKSTASKTTAVKSDNKTKQTQKSTTATAAEKLKTTTVTKNTKAKIVKSGVYDKKDDVAYYIYLYGHLPSNFITKKEAEKLGWTGGNLDNYAKGKCIGGDKFGNYEGALPKKKGRTYTECDIGTLGKNSRGAKRIVFSNDGLIYYTDDHYKTFTLLYGEE